MKILLIMSSTIRQLSIVSTVYFLSTAYYKQLTNIPISC